MAKAELPHIHESITEDRLLTAVRHSLFGASSPYGFCCKCGAEVPTEPDTAGDTCPSCGTPSVWGAEALNLIFFATSAGENQQ